MKGYGKAQKSNTSLFCSLIYTHASRWILYTDSSELLLIRIPERNSTKGQSLWWAAVPAAEVAAKAVIATQYLNSG